MSDYISREYLLDVLLPHSWRGTNKNIVPYNDRRGYRQRDREVREVIINAPSADVRENIKGEWINAKVGKLFPSNDYKCSICGNILNFDGVNCGRGDANFCPNCGADMRGE